MALRVIFREDNQPGGHKGKYVLSSKVFTSPEQAQVYANTISSSREPIVVFEYGERTDDAREFIDDVRAAARKYNEKYPLQAGD